MKGKGDIAEKASLEVKFKSRVGIRCQKNIPPETFLVDPSLALEPKDKQAKRGPSFFHALERLPAEGVTLIRGRSFHLKRSGLKVCLPTSKVWIRPGSSPFK